MQYLRYLESKKFIRYTEMIVYIHKGGGDNLSGTTTFSAMGIIASIRNHADFLDILF